MGHPVNLYLFLSRYLYLCKEPIYLYIKYIIYYINATVVSRIKGNRVKNQCKVFYPSVYLMIFTYTFAYLFNVKLDLKARIFGTIARKLFMKIKAQMPCLLNVFRIKSFHCILLLFWGPCTICTIRRVIVGTSYIVQGCPQIAVFKDDCTECSFTLVSFVA